MVQSFSRIKRFLPGLVVLLAGYAQAVSIAAPWSGQPLWWLQILSLAVLVALLQRAPSVRRAALMGWLFALSWLTGNSWWLFISMHNYGGLAAPLAVGAIVALSGFLALYYAAACAFYKHFSGFNHTEYAQAAPIFIATWTLAELARDTWLTGFPWGAGGYAHVDGPLAGLAAWLGVYGVGAAATALACGLVAVLLQVAARIGAVRSTPGSIPGPQPYAPALSRSAAALHKLRPTLWLALLCAALIGLGLAARETTQLVTASTGTTTVALLQGNIPQGEKFDNSKGVPFALEWYAQQLATSTATMTITPETAIPLLIRQLPDGYWARVKAKFDALHDGTAQAALIGIPLGSFEDGYTNSVMGLQPNKLSGAHNLLQNVMQPQPYRYDKHHLVPFGEFTPAPFKWFTRMMDIPLGDFNRGAVGPASFDFADQRWAPNICYEDLFGDELAARFVDASSAPTVLVNISNIGWFGNSIAIDQHLHISRMRALELGRPMVRATNTGPTVIINHRGEVSASLPRHTRGVLTGVVDGRTGITPFAWWAGRLGLLPLWGLGLAVVGWAVLTRSLRARKLTQLGKVGTPT